jgi:hypothetical protein
MHKLMLWMRGLIPNVGSIYLSSNRTKATENKSKPERRISAECHVYILKIGHAASLGQPHLDLVAYTMLHHHDVGLTRISSSGATDVKRNSRLNTTCQASLGKSSLTASFMVLVWEARSDLVWYSDASFVSLQSH